MKLEEQVCSLESAKRLKELGVKQDSLFYWNTNSYYNWVALSCGHRENEHIDTKECSAYTVAELGEMLPDNIYTQKGEAEFIPHRYTGGYFTAEGCWNLRAKTEAEARAKMLIYLLENKSIQP